MYEQHVKVAKESGSIKQMSCEQVKKLYPSGPDIDLKGKNVFVEEGGTLPGLLSCEEDDNGR